MTTKAERTDDWSCKDDCVENQKTNTKINVLLWGLGIGVGILLFGIGAVYQSNQNISSSLVQLEKAIARDTVRLDACERQVERLQDGKVDK